MENLITNIYNFISQFFGEITTNTWWSTHLDAIRGIATLCFCILVVLLGLAIVGGIWRFLTSLFDWRK